MNYLLNYLFLIIPFVCISQTEIIITGGNQLDIQNAITDFNNSSNGYGTISIKGDVLIQQNIDIPSKVTLKFFDGNKFVVSNGISLNIRGHIKKIINQIFETAELNHSIKIYNQPVHPEWFGQCSYQSTSGGNLQDDIQIQKSINSLEDGGKLIFVGNKYLINNEIDIDIPSVKLIGKGSYSSGSIISSDLIATNDSIPSIFNIKKYGLIIENLNFTKQTTTNKGVNATGKALNFVRANKSKDLDAWVYNCRFSHFKYCIYGEGANLKITDNLFASSYIGVIIREAQLDVSNSAQTRGHIIERNRFHSIGSYLSDSTLNGSTCVKISHIDGVSLPSLPEEAFTVRGYYNQISNNYADDCKTFFEGNVDRTKINNNTILFSGGTAIKAFGGYMGVISNNLIDGSFTWNANKLYPFLETDTEGLYAFPNGHGIHVNFAHFMTIHNNQILNKRFHGIYIERSKNSSIQSNTIMNFNRHRFIKRSGENPIVNDGRIYDGIHIEKVQDNDPFTDDKYNTQNIVTNNTISIPHNKIEGNFGIYVGDGDDSGFVKNNFITSTRLIQAIKIEQ
ncbi:right-handed parallel beta-helix repeat-containing protein [Winogradskyella luteola]|uniref:Uncharacterized protein n=1 Tax=Winogradskyella luteola TaxID=2828330 RepID=A0A9X1JP46_9FLAO|nr:right-handed parallel beta-helix repeat-containing protein [Winogradskyella luteola]MBV7268344.1 hypothetical protein [Winogradskyella luteola]